MALIAPALQAACVLAVLTALPAPGASPEVHVVLVLDHRYDDAASGTPVTDARVGDVVEFRLVRGFHTATRGAASVAATQSGGPDSPLLTLEGETYRFALAEPGPVPYTCLLHAQMEGLIVVR